VLSHARIWAAIDELASRNELTTSGLARRAGLDPTTFNPSKRVSGDGRQRWPSTESIAKILEATRTELAVFLGILGAPVEEREGPFRRVPLLGLAQAGAGGFFDDGGFPSGQGWDQVEFPGSDSAYALEVTGDSMLPLYRDGDIIVVSPGAPLRRGDRVVVKTRQGEVMAKILKRKTTKTVELLSLNPDHPNRTIPVGDVEWMARILWASQ
jgi:phage repressor protein C with HTH and peptisase S24 domain